MELQILRVLILRNYFYNKTNEVHYFSQIYFGIELYMFRTGLLSIIRSLVLYTWLTVCYRDQDGTSGSR
jgi:hypothetical protein